MGMHLVRLLHFANLEDTLSSAISDYYALGHTAYKLSGIGVASDSWSTERRSTAFAARLFSCRVPLPISRSAPR